MRACTLMLALPLEHQAAGTGPEKLLSPSQAARSAGSTATHAGRGPVSALPRSTSWVSAVRFPSASGSAPCYTHTGIQGQVNQSSGGVYRASRKGKLGLSCMAAADCS